MIGGFEYWVREGYPVEDADGVHRRPVDPLTGVARIRTHAYESPTGSPTTKKAPGTDPRGLLHAAQRAKLPR